MSQCANYTDYQLFYCCNDFNINAPNITLGSATRQTSRHNFPVISYTPANQLVSYALENVGAFARDPMDRRLMTPLQNNVIATQAINGTDYFNGSFLKDAAETFPTDTDNDGMADVWETATDLVQLLPTIMARNYRINLRVLKVTLTWNVT